LDEDTELLGAWQRAVLGSNPCCAFWGNFETRIFLQIGELGGQGKARERPGEAPGAAVYELPRADFKLLGEE